jgi:thioredoxin 1
VNTITGLRIAIIAAVALAIVIVVGLKNQRADSSVQPPQTAVAPMTSPAPTPTAEATTTVKPGAVCPPTSVATSPDPATTKPPTPEPGEPPSTPVEATPAEQPVAAVPVAKALPRMLELGSETCQPCIMMVDVMAALRAEYPNTLQVDFVDVNKDTDATKRYRVRAIPTQVFFDAEGKEIYRHMGYYPKEDIVAKFTELGITL